MGSVVRPLVLSLVVSAGSVSCSTATEDVDASGDGITTKPGMKGRDVYPRATTQPGTTMSFAEAPTLDAGAEIEIVDVKKGQRWLNDESDRECVEEDPNKDRPS